MTYLSLLFVESFQILQICLRGFEIPSFEERYFQQSSEEVGCSNRFAYVAREFQSIPF